MEQKASQDEKNNENEEKNKNEEKNENIESNTQPDFSQDETITTETDKSVKPWVSYAMAVCSGLKNHLNDVSNKISSLETKENSTDNSIKELAIRNEMISNALNELNNLTKRAKCIEQSSLKPKKIKEALQLDKKSDDKENSGEKLKLSSDNFVKSPENLSLQTVQSTKSQSPNKSIDFEQLAKIIQNEFKCSICQEILINATILLCSHAFCKVCINQWLSNSEKCPICRTLTTFRKQNTFHALPIDNFLSLYYQNFASKTEQSNRLRLVNERQSKDVLIAETNPPLTSQSRLPSLIHMEILETPRVRHRHLQRNRRSQSERPLRISGSNQENRIRHRNQRLRISGSDSENRIRHRDRRLMNRSGNHSNNNRRSNSIFMPTTSRSTQLSLAENIDLISLEHLDNSRLEEYPIIIDIDTEMNSNDELVFNRARSILIEEPIVQRSSIRRRPNTGASGQTRNRSVSIMNRSINRQSGSRTRNRSLSTMNRSINRQSGSRTRNSSTNRNSRRRTNTTSGPNIQPTETNLGSRSQASATSRGLTSGQRNRQRNSIESRNEERRRLRRLARSNRNDFLLDRK